MGDFGNSKMASITKITNRLHFAKRMFSTSTARMSHASPAEVSLWKKLFFFGAVPVIALDIIWPSGHTLLRIPEKIHMQDQILSPTNIFESDQRNSHGEMETNHSSITRMQTPYPMDMKRVTIIKGTQQQLHMKYLLGTT